jgi:uncharacterized protein (DUF924 family)
MGAYLAEVLPFWQEHIDRPELPPWKRYQAWYSPDPKGLQHFEDLLETLLAEPTGARDISNTAATIILLDQFPRKLFAGEPRAYAGHDSAAAIAGPLLKHGKDRPLPMAVRIALTMSLCSVEQPAAADAAVNWFDTKLASEQGGDRDLLAGFYAIARRRQEVLRQYGRYPGRNRILNRDDTQPEADLLEGHATEFS